jgi:hypothetical protein
MKSRFLFPSYFRVIGLLMALPGFVLGYFVVFNEYQIPDFVLKLRSRSYIDRGAFENFTNELALTLVVVGLLFIAFSKMKREDELTARIRLNALYWAILINFLFYVLCLVVALFNSPTKNDEYNSVFINSDHFMIYNLFMPLLIFIIRFYYLLYKNRDEYQVTRLYFLPNKPFNVIGKVLTVVLIVPAVYVLFGDLLDDSKMEYACYFLPFAFMLWIYSKEKVEDEYINMIRLEAMQIAVYVNYSILLLSNIFCYGVLFLMVQLINIITIPLIFVIIFQYRLHRLAKETGHKNGSNLNVGLL